MRGVSLFGVSPLFFLGKGERAGMVSCQFINTPRIDKTKKGFTLQLLSLQFLCRFGASSATSGECGRVVRVGDLDFYLAGHWNN